MLSTEDITVHGKLYPPADSAPHTQCGNVLSVEYHTLHEILVPVEDGSKHGIMLSTEDNTMKCTIY